MLKPAFIDLSHHNTIPDSLMPAKESGILGVIHKLTESDDYTDNMVEARYRLAKRARMLWGLYHFIRPGDAGRQAEFFCNKAVELGVADDRTLLCLDYEDAGVSIDQALEFMAVVEEMTGHQPVIYSGHVLKEKLGGKADPRLSKYRLWIAQYGPEADLPPGWDQFWGWQYTESGSVPGIDPPVDLNAYWGTAFGLPGDWSGNDIGPAPPVEGKIVRVTIATPPGVRVDVDVEQQQARRIARLRR